MITSPDLGKKGPVLHLFPQKKEVCCSLPVRGGKPAPRTAESGTPAGAGAGRKLRLLLAHAAWWGDRFPTAGPIWLQRKKLSSAAT